MRSLAFALLFVPIAAAVAAVVLLGPLPERPGLCLALLGVGGAAWAAALGLARARHGATPIVLAGAVCLRLLALAGDPGTSDDVHRYVWEGALVLDGVSPYALAPDHPSLGAQRERRAGTYARMNNHSISAAYPPLTQAAAALAVLAAGGAERDEGRAAIARLRWTFAAADLGALLVVAALLRRRGQPSALAVAWGWCPLVALEFAGAGHFDSLGILLLLSALALLEPGRARARAALGALLLAGAVLVKYVPLVALPYCARARRSVWLAPLVLGLVALGFTPLFALRGGIGGLGAGLGEYGLRWESASLVYRWIEPLLVRLHPLDESLLDPRRVGRAMVGLAFAAAALVEWRARRDPLRASARLIAAFLVLSPTLHPWYVTWIVPFLALHPSAAFTWLAAAAPLLYWPLTRWRAEGVWHEPAWLWPALALPFFALLARDAWRRR